MTTNERGILERFLQYGDLENAKVVFMGYEEGVASLPSPNDVIISIEARKLLHSDPKYTNCRVDVNGKNDTDGWYIDETKWISKTSNSPLTDAIYAAIKNLGYIIKWKPPTVNVVNMQTRFHWLLQGQNRTKDYLIHAKTKRSRYSSISNRHMIDFYPFPKRGKNSWDKILNIGTITDKTYYNHYNTLHNNRVKLLTNLYNLLPMDITVSYLGISGGKLLNENFFTNVGFKFGPTQDTSQVNPKLNTPIKPSPKPKIFKIGTRTKKDRKKQKVVLTPFLGIGQIGYNDIDVISTWL